MQPRRSENPYEAPAAELGKKKIWDAPLAFWQSVLGVTFLVCLALALLLPAFSVTYASSEGVAAPQAAVVAHVLRVLGRFAIALGLFSFVGFVVTSFLKFRANWP